MKGLDANNLCSHGGDMLAYLYDEMAAADRAKFELHLAECDTCVDDFAELSQSRYPVYEWKRIQFDPLPTPRVVVPIEAAASASWFDQIRTAFSLRLAFGGVAAAMIVAAFTGYFVFVGSRAETEVAQEVEPTASPTRVAVTTPSPSGEIKSETVSENVVNRADEPKPVKASASKKTTVRPTKPRPAQPTRQSEPIPVLSSLEDDEDDSLRLADIFDEIGTSE